MAKNLLRLLVILLLFHGSTVSTADEIQPLDYLRDVRPILAEHCFACHGPDAAKRQSDLRLDQRRDATSPRNDGTTPIRPGYANESELVRRIESSDPDTVMPPPETKRQLTAAQKLLLRRWIDAGAPYAEHWAYQKPSRPTPPIVHDPTWCRNQIDPFVLAKLEANTLSPSSEASRATLIRRLSLDLTGLPPTIEQVDEFLADESPGAYERLVDRLSASPHFGEKMSQDWLDLARFGDSSGYQDDGDRPNSPYRDYVIEAFNANMQFDQFTIENLAGDLLPNASLSQKVAAGFNRLHRHNEEGGSDPDEFQVAYAVDRTNTMATVWMGITLGCAQCHDHKYDPFSQREYYQLYAFFNSLKGEVPVSKTASPPQARVPSDIDLWRLDRINHDFAEADRRKQELSARIAAAFEIWLKEQAAASRTPEEIARLRQVFTVERYPEFGLLEMQLAELGKRREALEKSVPLALVWEEMDEPRLARILSRGDYQLPGDVVARNVPAVLPKMSVDKRPDRLALAQWLVSGEHPLTSRVAVNRMWKQCFGNGLVRTCEDFGVRGEPPTHPELHDWLATEFAGQSVANGLQWDTKRLVRLIVTSATYRQSSTVTPHLREIDPENRLLARGSRFRLSAEEIRDLALAVSGLLTHSIGGRSVYPYQPDHFYRDKEDDPGEWKWPLETGSELYRRGLYTFVRRTTPYPAYQTFDAPSRGECTVARSRTNTPLQALVTLNDPAFVEAARVLGERIAMWPTDHASRLAFAFRTVLSRLPTPRERTALDKLFQAERERYVADRESAMAVAAHGKAPRVAGADPVEVAAWTAVAAVLLNVDEAITRE